MISALDLRADLAASMGFFTRLPMPFIDRGARPFAEALWAAPVAGFAVALIGGVTYWIASAVGLHPSIAALLCLAATMLATGCLHEDGLADLADGFGGGRTREAKLAIMRDSRIGTFGVATVIVAIGLRWAALGTIAEHGEVWTALLAAHGASRGVLPLFLSAVPPARIDGLAAGLGHVPAATAWTALALGCASTLCLGLSAALTALPVIALAFLLVRRLCLKQIGGQTGDVCGALQQAIETLLLLLASARFS